MRVASGATAAASQRPALTQTGVKAGTRALPRSARYVFPSLPDVVFVSLLLAAFGALGPNLLEDADIGWHIRNGDHILATHAVPRTDYFSYTMAGRPWYAWEWLYDAAISKIHFQARLDGVVLLSCFLAALTFAWLFR